MNPLVVAAITVVAIAAVAAAILVRRRYRASHEIFVSYPTMFGNARIFTIEQDEQTGLHPEAEGAHPAASDDATLIRVMELGGAFQSATYLDERCYEPVFDYYKMYDRAFNARIPIRNTLMLGGGGYAYPKYLISRRPDVRMDVVEIDPDITLIAQRYFFLDRLIVEFETEENGRLELITDDARHYLEEYGAALSGAGGAGSSQQGGTAPGCVSPLASSPHHIDAAPAERPAATPAPQHAATLRNTPAERPAAPAPQHAATLRNTPAERPAAPAPRRAPYDAIFNDCFAGTKPVMTLATVEAARAVKRCLAPGGVYLSNVISPLEGEGIFLHDIANTLKTTFAHVYVVPCGRFAKNENDNEMVIATDGVYRFEGAFELRVYPDGKILSDADAGHE